MEHGSAWSQSDMCRILVLRCEVDLVIGDTLNRSFCTNINIKINIVEDIISKNMTSLIFVNNTVCVFNIVTIQVLSPKLKGCGGQASGYKISSLIIEQSQRNILLKTRSVFSSCPSPNVRLSWV